jgi:hypothetical protein
MIIFPKRPTTMIVIMAFLAVSLSPQANAQEWHPVTSILLGISGMALIEGQTESQLGTGSSFLIVHDNKKTGEPRLAIIGPEAGKPARYLPLPWPNADLPVDLEALTALPGDPNSFVALSSAGAAYRIKLNAARTAFEVVKVFKVPDALPTSNFEGFSLQRLGNAVLAVWAHRGKNVEPAILYWSRLDLDTYHFSPVQSARLSVPWPGVEAGSKAEVRHVSDLKVTTTGALFVTAASDAGDDGPFQSALYLAGILTFSNDKFSLFQGTEPLLLQRFPGHKVEAFDFVPGSSGPVLGTDDENLGSSVLFDW